jgi:hypothetical protein
MLSTDEDFDPRNVNVALPQTEMGSNSESSAPRWLIQPELLANRRARTISAYHQGGAKFLPIDSQTYDNALFRDQPFDSSICVHLDARGCRGRGKQDLVQQAATLPQTRRAKADDSGGSRLPCLSMEVKSDPVKRAAADGRGEAQALQHRDAFRHEAFTTRFFSRESRLFEDAYGHTLAPEHERERGARDAAPHDENIAHLLSLKSAFIEGLAPETFTKHVNIGSAGSWFV